ncbi:MAG TPA: insulinase family protein [Holophagaceae bacterium]|nr:insulinase family protein [Holophagaceae bacterium]
MRRAALLLLATPLLAAHAPVPGSAPAAAAPLPAPVPAKAFTLPCGLQVQLLEDHDLPLVRAELSLALDPPATEARPWVRDLGFSLLRRGGSGHRGRAEFDRALDTLGVDIRQEVQPTWARWSLLARSRDQDLALGLLADLVLRPAFDGTALEAERGRVFDLLSRTGPLARTEQEFRAALLGIALPSEQDLGALTLADLGRWHRSTFRPDRARLVLHGDLDLAQARQLATLALGTWTADPAQPAAPPAAAAPPATFVIARDGAPTEVRAGLGILTLEASPLLPWLRMRLAAQGVELLSEGGLLVARLRGPASFRDLQGRLEAALKGLEAGPDAQDLARLATERVVLERLRPLHPAVWARDLALDAPVPGTERGRALASGWTRAKAWLWIGTPSALAAPGQGAPAQSATPKRDARSR